MDNFPTPSNPLILIYQGIIPAMKNDTQVYLADVVSETGSSKTVAGVGRSKATNIWLTGGAQMAERQMKLQGFTKMIMPHRVACFCVIGMYRSPSNRDLAFVPRNDLDNAYTTIQETWKDTIMDDDKQLIDYRVSTRIFTNKQSMYSSVFVWSTLQADEPTQQQTDEMLAVCGYAMSKPTWQLMKDKLDAVKV